eukprot:CAMPEP_0113946698 /NCGR_PEP_ID=MMETSP1339-20121228/59600_1 /TAXON_ID=94617 /ORGANISM="Fibrocapsa japonica" /LENGTH=199 /DNA_ID=CAMNT_0000952923 /DNA_START=13 /DNA_END=612 /DNA_ORIENTATION=- /assembly_acc=CAM_ASM_000762
MNSIIPEVKSIGGWVRLLRNQNVIISPKQMVHRLAFKRRHCQECALLALDVGETKVGFAVSDDSCSLSTPVAVVPRNRPIYSSDSLQNLGKYVMHFVHKYQAAGMVVGWPLLPSGVAGPQCGRVLAVVSGLHQQNMLPVPAMLWDETLTTVAAQHVVRRFKAKKRRVAQDKVAAAIILEDFLHSAEAEEYGLSNLGGDE